MKPPKPVSAKRLTAITPPANATPFTEWVVSIGYSKEAGQLWRRKGVVTTFHHPNTEKGKVFIHTAEAKRFLAVLSGEKPRTITPPTSLIEKELEDFRYAAVSLHSPALSTITGSQPWQIPPDDDWRADYRRAWSQNPPAVTEKVVVAAAAVPEFAPAARWPFSKFWHLQHDRNPYKTHLAEVVQTIRTSTHIARQIMELRKCLAITPHAYSGQKMHLPAVAFSGIFSGGHKATQLTRHSGLIVIGVKNLTTDQLAEVRSKLVQDKRLVALFVSPCGTGLKCLFWTRRPAADHQLVWSDIISGVSSLTGLPIIISGGDVASINAGGRSVNSLCFLSHDPDAVYHHEAEEWFVLAGDPSDAGKIVE